MAILSETTGDKLLGFESGQSFRLNFAGKFLLSGCVVELGDVVEMPHRERRFGFRMLASELLDFGGNAIVNRQEFADFAGRLPGEFGDLLLREIEFVAEPSESVGGFFGAEIGTLPVVDDLIDQHVFRVALLNPAGEFDKAEAFGREEATATVDDHVFARGGVPADGERLLDAA